MPYLVKTKPIMFGFLLPRYIVDVGMPSALSYIHGYIYATTECQLHVLLEARS